MRDTFFYRCGRDVPRPERADIARLARLTHVNKSAGHQLASRTNLPTKVSWLANGTYRFLAICSREILSAESQLQQLRYNTLHFGTGLFLPQQERMPLTAKRAR